VNVYLGLSLGTILLLTGAAVLLAPPPIGVFGLTWLAASILRVVSGIVMIALAIVLFIAAARSEPRERSR